MQNNNKLGDNLDDSSDLPEIVLTEEEQFIQDKYGKKARVQELDKNLEFTERDDKYLRSIELKAREEMENRQVKVFDGET